MKFLPTLLASILLLPTCAAFTIESGPVIQQGNANFYLDDEISLDVGTLHFDPSDGAPIYDEITLGYTSASASEWTIQHMGGGRVILNGTPSAGGTMRFAGWPAYQVSGVLGLAVFDREDPSAWPVVAGAQTITIVKIPTQAQAAQTGIMQAIGLALLLFLVAIALATLVAITVPRS